jgi:hypothetical protein
MKPLTFILPAVFLLIPLAPSISVGEPFRVTIVDQAGRPVPHVRLTTDNGIVCYTRRDGTVNWTESSLMNRDVYFKIDSLDRRSGKSGTTLRVTHGGRSQLTILR